MTAPPWAPAPVKHAQPLERLRVDLTAQMEALAATLRAALPMAPVDPNAPWVMEFQYRRGDGVWHGCDALTAARYHQQGVQVRERKATPWQEVAPL